MPDQTLSERPSKPPAAPAPTPGTAGQGTGYCRLHAGGFSQSGSRLPGGNHHKTATGRLEETI